MHTIDQKRPGFAEPAATEAALAAEVARRLGQAMVDAIATLGDPAPDAVALTVPRAPVALAPVRLARSHPGGVATRRQMQSVYERCLAHYRLALRPQDEARGVDDVGAAVARFVAANFHALQGTEATPQMLLALERQLAGVVRGSPAWAGASAAERQVYFEKIALLAVFVAELAQQAPRQGRAAVENLQRAARAYLRELLGLNPDALALGPEGLVARGPSAG